jgi:hypothetical protein
VPLVQICIIATRVAKILKERGRTQAGRHPVKDASQRIAPARKASAWCRVVASMCPPTQPP